MSKPKMINIQRQCYAMASVDNENAEITMYGEVVESWPIDWWTGERIEGNFIAQDEFLEDLEKVAKCRNITIRINSYGGDCGVGFLIHNRLRELSASGTKLTCIVDGVAMSAASVIMCACDTVKVNPTALIMVHRCWSYMWGSYNADELRRQADAHDAYDKAICAAYQRKTGLSETVLLHMMSDTTYMTGKEAVQKGFCDELIEDAEPVQIAASADGRSIFARGHQIRLAPGVFAPDTIPTVEAPAPEASAEETTLTAEVPAQPTAEANINLPETSGEGGNEAMTPEELRAQYPEAVAAIEAAATQAAVNAERERQQEIDTVAGLFNDDLVAAARYGETACSAQELSFRAAQQAAQQGTAFLANLAEDAAASNAEEVTPAPAPEDAPEASEENLTPEQRQDNAREAVKALLHNN